MNVAKLCRILLVLGLAVVLNGCGSSEQSSSSVEMSAGAPASAPAASTASDAPSDAASDTEANTKAMAAPGNATGQLVKAASAVPRKIIYTATVELVSDSFPQAQQNLLKLVKQNGGYIAQINLSGTSGAPRVGTWKIRIPEGRFESFMAAVAKLGELQSTNTDSQDVTEEFYDLQARISNKQVEEKRLLQHLQNSTAKLKDILEVEREISRVRGEIEQMQGRLRLLANLTSLTTVTVTLREVKNYVPPKPATFGDQIARTFSASIGQLRDFGKGIVLFLVALAPWLVIGLIIAVPVWRIARRKKP